MEKGRITRITISLKIDSKLWNKVQHKCVDERRRYSAFVEEALKEKLEGN
jgi:hypothetical protein